MKIQRKDLFFMKCSRCGADCDPSQLFCLRCGNPLNGNKTEGEVIKEVEVPIEDMVNAISFNDDNDDIDLIIDRDISRQNKKNNNMSSGKAPKKAVGSNGQGNGAVRSSSSDGNGTKKPVQNKNTGRPQSAGKGENNKNRESKKADNNSKKKKIIIGSVIAAVLVVVVIVAVIITKSGNYDDHYSKGMTYYESGNVDSSIKEFSKAVSAADSTQEKIAANEMLWKSYLKKDNTDAEQINVLNELVKLDPNNETYYTSLITLYQSIEDQTSIDNLINSVEDSQLRETLKKFDGKTPVPSVEPGSYDKPISLEFTVAKGHKIYYTINGGDATSSSDVYKKAIEFSEQGEYLVKAISIDKKGKQSEQFTGKYILSFTNVNEPVISLDNGTYNERKKVTVTADAGCKIYYTTDESVPTKDSKEYTKPFKIPEKNTVYSFVAIDEKGVSSKVVTRVYNYKKVYVYDYNKAISNLTNLLISKGKMENAFGSYEDGSVMYFEYQSLEEIKDKSYYIINATKESKTGETLSNDTFAFETDTGMCYKAKLSGGKYQLSDIE